MDSIIKEGYGWNFIGAMACMFVMGFVTAVLIFN